MTATTCPRCGALANRGLHPTRKHVVLLEPRYTPYREGSVRDPAARKLFVSSEQEGEPMYALHGVPCAPSAAAGHGVAEHVCDPEAVARRQGRTVRPVGLWEGT